jgi:hypothetical protein
MSAVKQTNEPRIPRGSFDALSSPAYGQVETALSWAGWTASLIRRARRSLHASGSEILVLRVDPQRPILAAVL